MLKKIFETRVIPGKHLLFALRCLLFPACLSAGVIRVTDGESLSNAVDGANGGDTVLVETGTYGGFEIENRNFSEEAPLIILAAPGEEPIIESGSWYIIPITQSSYIAIDGLTIDGGGQPIYATDVDHLILANLEVRNTGQEAIHIRGTSRYVDILNCHVHHTGSAEPQWAEGVYVGSGNQPFMNSEHIWIEGCDIHHTGASEGINIKAQSYHVTIRGNTVHDIAPGTASQYNQAAISLESADLSFKPGEDPGIWIENNEVYNVALGAWANGMQASTMGPRIVGNRVRDVEEYCIFFNDFQNGPGSFPTYLYDNQTENCGEGVQNNTSLTVLEEDPGPNPNQPQGWYRSEISSVAKRSLRLGASNLHQNRDVMGRIQPEPSKTRFLLPR